MGSVRRGPRKHKRKGEAELPCPLQGIGKVASLRRRLLRGHASMLDTWIAERFADCPASGRTQPLVLSCRPIREPDGEARDFVVKAEGLPEMYGAKLYAELFGNLLARSMGIATPDPALVEIPRELVPLIRLSLAGLGRSAVPNAGLAAGSRFLGPGAAPPATRQPMQRSEIAEAALIYAFDMAVQNPDRLASNPNCIAHRGRFYAIDFETCFSFALMLPLGGQPRPWKVSEHRLYPRHDHLFGETLRGARIDWEPIEHATASMTEGGLRALTVCVPSQWKSHEDRILAHLLELAAHSSDFVEELRRSLA